ncbi:hypothetical protein H7X69_01495 [Candidatus Saccharibacteria bacterium]|nr:hypothetical protein [Candidatus Saccharibacteria bacterium]
MNKDVIYIDVEDDITAIIGKIKASSEKIVALVPPKRVGILQSAVNLRLLERMAKNANKRMVLITNNQALIALSAVAGIPVAKNLQTKPEVAEIPALSVDDGDDIIDGAQLPIGELEKTADITNDGDESVNKAINSIDIDEKSVSVAALGASVAKKFNKTTSNVKVPNFNSFRKKLFIGIAAAVLLIGFLVWAVMFAPAAKVIITARTTAASVNATATLGGNAATDVAKGLIQSTFQTTKKDVSVDFTATGSKDIGEKATGTMTVTRTSVSNSALTVPVGTTFTSGDLIFASTQATTLAGTQIGPNGIIQDSATIKVVASNSGETYNLSARSYQSNVSGISSDGSAMAGGTTKIVVIVTADDVQKASAALVEQPSDQVKAQLIKLFTNGEVVIDDSFTIDRAPATSVPAIGAEATGKAKLTSSTTYTITAIAKSDLEIYLKANLEKQLIGKSNQRVYDNGIKKVKLSGYAKTGDTSTVKIISTGQIGPKIDEAAIKEQVKGKIYGEVQSNLQAIDGVSNVDVQFSFFWVRTVPNNIDKITVEFKLENE